MYGYRAESYFHGDNNTTHVLFVDFIYYMNASEDLYILRPTTTTGRHRDRKIVEPKYYHYYIVDLHGSFHYTRLLHYTYGYYHRVYAYIYNTMYYKYMFVLSYIYCNVCMYYRPAHIIPVAKM